MPLVGGDLIYAFYCIFSNQTEGLSMGRIVSAGDDWDESHGAGWRKSSHSMSNGQCLETARLTDGRIGVRDSRAAKGPVLRFEPEAWGAFLAELRTSQSYPG